MVPKHQILNSTVKGATMLITLINFCISFIWWGLFAVLILLLLYCFFGRGYIVNTLDLVLSSFCCVLAFNFTKHLSTSRCELNCIITLCWVINKILTHKAFCEIGPWCLVSPLLKIFKTGIQRTKSWVELLVRIKICSKSYI